MFIMYFEREVWHGGLNEGRVGKGDGEGEWDWKQDGFITYIMKKLEFHVEFFN